ncbi:serine protease HTRA2, mitochondrial isoform X2 [Harpegnathos saltator]|uniref:Serine protease HTRA2, mitochondrial n=1 Tax=Harpegnathos saltator TaxID=610380 RepID=E2BYN0_HARSA|nr:serine protease HTRA2, mitochondrial isoform X2 [Harpegnathos saltator]EFN79184.1 Serine protease HTRA2, mitochondrial [Harpegnathos saltator]
MVSFLSRLSWSFLVKRHTNLSRCTLTVFTEPCTQIRPLHSQQQQQRKVHEKKGNNLLTYTVFVSGLCYAIYKWKDDIWQGIKSFDVYKYSVVHATSSQPPSNSQNRDKYNFIADVVKICAPSVVYIEVKDTKRIDIFTGKPATTGNGSGFIVSEDGLILTNAHVVISRPNATVQVRLHDGSVHIGVIEDVDIESDLATVRINKTKLPVMKLGSSANIRPGEFVVAIGSPLALSNSITSGVVSSVNRNSSEIGLYNKRMGYIQTDAAITFGNSGGPLVNLDGEAIGINAMKVTVGISFAIPIDYAKEFLKKTEARRKNKGLMDQQDRHRRRYLGLTMQSLMPDILNEIQQNNKYTFLKHGVLVWNVIIGSPADNAGLQPRDIITHANGEPVVSSADIYKLLEQSGILRLKVLRGESILHIDAIPEEV